jgi:hypothetical protein
MAGKATSEGAIVNVVHLFTSNRVTDPQNIAAAVAGTPLILGS